MLNQYRVGYVEILRKQRSTYWLYDINWSGIYKVTQQRFDSTGCRYGKQHEILEEHFDATKNG